MKIAYCFSGYLRRFWTNPTLVENVIKRAPGDLFVHTWNTLNYGGATWHGDTGLSNMAVDDVVLSFLRQQYGTPARLVVEAPPAFPPELMPVIQARYSVWRANALKAEVERERGFTYDLVVNLRFDLLVHEPFTLPTKGLDTLRCLANANCVSQGLCCDILDFGSSPVMDVVADLYGAIRDGIVTEPNTSSGERFLTKWCAMNALPFTYVSVRSSILRSDGSLLDIPLPRVAA
jgi:hypothetical protein